MSRTDDERTPLQLARAVWIAAYGAASKALGVAARTHAADVLAQADGSSKVDQLGLGLKRDKAASALDEACDVLQEAALKLLREQQ